MINVDMVEQIRDRLISELTGGEEKIKQTPVSFSMEVEKLAKEENISLLESIVVLVETYGLEPEQMGKMISPGLKQKLAIENGIENPGKELKF